MHNLNKINSSYGALNHLSNLAKSSISEHHKSKINRTYQDDFDFSYHKPLDLKSSLKEADMNKDIILQFLSGLHPRVAHLTAQKLLHSLMSGEMAHIFNNPTHEDHQPAKSLHQAIANFHKDINGAIHDEFEDNLDKMQLSEEDEFFHRKNDVHLHHKHIDNVHSQLINELEPANDLMFTYEQINDLSKRFDDLCMDDSIAVTKILCELIRVLNHTVNTNLYHLSSPFLFHFNSTEELSDLFNADVTPRMHKCKPENVYRMLNIRFRDVKKLIEKLENIHNQEDLQELMLKELRLLFEKDKKNEYNEKLCLETVVMKMNEYDQKLAA